MNRKMRRMAQDAVEFSKECYFQMQEHGIDSMAENEQASARCFEELLHTSLSEIEIGLICCARGYTYKQA